VGSEEGGVRRRFWERMGRRGGARARGDGGNCVRLASSRGRRKPGRAHAVVRGGGGGGLGRSEAKAQWGGRPTAGLGRRRWPKRGGGGSGPTEGQGRGGWAENWRWTQAQKEIPFEFQLILEFGRNLKNCTRSFRKKFDMRIFPKIF
jgi:hypothetical protein